MSQRPTFFMIHSAITIMAQTADYTIMRPNPRTIGGFEAYCPKLGEDYEVCQMACDFPMKVVNEHQFRAAFNEMREASLVRAREAGLVKS